LNELIQAHSDLLQTYPWDTYITVTCRRPRKDASNLVHGIWRTLEKFDSSRCFVAIEPHYVGNGLHAHGLVRFPNWQAFNSTSLWRYLFKQFGRTTVEQCREVGKVSTYCAKYVVKERSHEFYYFGTKEAWLHDIL